MKKIIIGLIILSTLLVGCEQQDLSSLSEEAKPEESEELTEDTVELKCSDKCSIGFCEGKSHVACLKQEDGCKDKISKGKVIGECGVECLEDFNCEQGEECNSNKCERSCSDECSSTGCEGLYYVKCVVGTDGCKDKESREKIKGKCGVECLEDSDCSSDETCSFNKCEEKSDFSKALEELTESIEDYQEKTSKLDECTEVCAGENYDIPAIKNEWYYACYEIYTYLGEEGLDEQIAKCEG